MKFVFDRIDKKDGISEGNSFCFFENKECQCYPCHNLEKINCLFCYCPLYHLDDCGGNYTFTDNIKDCTNCTLPHKAENYFYVIQKIAEENEGKRLKNEGND